MPTNRDDELLMILGDVRGKVDLLLKASDSQSGRLSDLEGWKNKLVGLVIGASAIAGGVGAKIATVLTGIAAHP